MLLCWRDCCGYDRRHAFFCARIWESDARRWVCEVVARASRIRCGLVFGSAGSQGLCQIGEPSYLLKADDCDGTVLVVVMMIVMIVNGKNCV